MSRETIEPGRITYRTAMTLPTLIRTQRYARNMVAGILDALDGVPGTEEAQTLARDMLFQCNAAIAYNIETARLARQAGMGIVV